MTETNINDEQKNKHKSWCKDGCPCGVRVVCVVCGWCMTCFSLCVCLFMCLCVACRLMSVCFKRSSMCCLVCAGACGAGLLGMRGLFGTSTLTKCYNGSVRGGWAVSPGKPRSHTEERPLSGGCWWGSCLRPTLAIKPTGSWPLTVSKARTTRRSPRTRTWCAPTTCMLR